MKNKYLAFTVTAAASLALLALLVFSLVALSTPTQAAPPAAPTPVADAIFGSVQPGSISFQTATVLVADTNTAGVEVMKFSALDMQYVSDQTVVVATSETNTTTLTIQYSNDNTNWVDGVALVSANAVDGTTITRVPVFGRYVRVKQDVTNSNPVTFTITAVGR